MSMVRMLAHAACTIYGPTEHMECWYGITRRKGRSWASSNSLRASIAGEGRWLGRALVGGVQVRVDT